MDKPDEESGTPVELPVHARKRRRFDGRVSITVTLTVAIGLLVFISVGSVLWVGLWSAQKNTFSLLSSNVNQSVFSSVNRIRQHLQPAEYQSRFIAEQIEAGELDPANEEQMRIMLTGALAAAPQITAIMFIDPDLRQFGVGFDPQTKAFGVFVDDLSTDPQAVAAMRNNNPNPNWGPPVWREDLQTAYLNRIHPVIVGTKFVGVIVSVVPISVLSDFVTEQDARSGATSFILYGRDSVLAHANMVDGYPGRSIAHPLPMLVTFNDPVLSHMWNGTEQERLLVLLDPGTRGFELAYNGENYVFVYRAVPGFGKQPMIVGSYFYRSDVSDEVQRLMISMGVGVAALLLSLVAAIIVGRRISRPIVRFSEAATKIRDLEISNVQNLPSSRFRELNEQSIAFNAMLRALRWFELYVPRKVVTSLIRRGDMEEFMSDARDVTILFTDMAGFSTISENMSAVEVAKLMNEHFALIVSCIEAEDGTVDKFIGDSVMAFWGAPEIQADHAERACRAALAVSAAIRSDNERRTAAGLPAIGIRIGIHSGSATVGNIGTPDRLNYTIIGDSVNIGQRLEQLGKDVFPKDQDVSILISDDTAKAVGDGFSVTSVGKRKLKGRTGELEVFELNGN